MEISEPTERDGMEITRSINTQNGPADWFTDGQYTATPAS